MFLTNHGGPDFFVGNGPGANGTWRIPTGIDATVIRDAYTALHGLVDRQLNRAPTPGEYSRRREVTGTRAS